MKPSKKLLAVGLLTTLLVTGCNQGKKEDQPGDKDKPVEPDTKKVTAVTLNKNELTLEEEASELLTATITPSDADNQGLKWESNNEDVAMVNSLGKVRALSAGDAIITVSSLENPSIKATCAVKVTAKDRTVHVTGVSLNVSELELDKGDKEALIATIAPSNATNKEVEWSSDNENIASVSATGLVEGKAKGTAVITVKSKDDVTKTASCTVTVIDNYIAVESVVISSSDEHFKVEDNVKKLELQDVDRPLGQLTVTVKGLDDNNQPVDPTNPKVIWSVSEGQDVVTVSSSGQVTALKVGTAKVVAISEDDPTKFDEVVITVVAESPKDTTIHVDSISWDANLPESINLGDEANISVIVSPSNTNYTKVNFSLATGDSEFATLTEVSNNVCNITAIKPGIIHLTAVAEDQANSPEPIQATINIIDPVTHVTGIELGSALINPVLFKGDTLELVGNFTVLPANATNKAVTFASSNEEVLSVNNSGKLTARLAGTSTVTITSVEDPSVYQEIEFVVKNIQADAIENVAETKTLEIGDTFQLEPTVRFKDGTTGSSVTYSSSNEAVAKVNANGLISALTTGTTVITVTANPVNVGDPEVKAQCTVTVVDTRPILINTFKPSEILSYEQKTASENLTAVEGIQNNSSVDKGDFFEGTEDELIYKVGNKGLFKFNPTAKARYANEEELDYEGEIEWERKVEKFVGSEYVDAPTAEYSDEDEGIRFTNAEIGAKYRLSVKPVETDDYKVNTSVDYSTIEFQVVKGYNAYSLADLSLYANVPVRETSPIDWSQYRASHGVQATFADAVDGIVLHKNISIVSEILPEASLYTKTYWDAYLKTTNGQNDYVAWKGSLTDEQAQAMLYDSPRDMQTLLSRENTMFDDNFVLEGNFFTVDASSLKQIVRGPDENLVSFAAGDGSHSQIFGVNVADWGGIEDGDVQDHVTFKNLAMVGNGSISSTTYSVASAKGGFMGVKAGGVDFKASNILSRSMFTAFLPEAHDDDSLNKQAFTIERSKVYDTYNSSFYVFGCNASVIDSWMSESGGPLFILDEFKDKDYSWEQASDPNFKLRPCNVTCENSYLYNPVTGTEPWFAGHAGASGMVQDYLINGGDPTNAGGWIGQVGYGGYNNGITTARTITGFKSSEKVINLIAIVMNASNFASNVYKQLESVFTVNNDETGTMDMADTTKFDPGIGHKVTTTVPTAVCPIICKSSLGGVGYIDGSTMQPGTTLTSPSTTEEQLNFQKFVTGQYMSYFLDPVLGGVATPASEDGFFFGIFLGTYTIKGNWAE